MPQNNKYTIAPSLILLCDLEGYSLRSQQDQEELIKELWFIALGDEFLKSRPKEFHIWGTGDGFYLLFRNPEEKLLRECYEFGVRLIQNIEAMEEGLRVAIHVGDSQFVDLKEHGFPRKREVAGNGLNEIARIVSYAAKGQIVFSEDFWKKLPNQDKDDLWDDVEPAHTDNAITLYVKHGKRVEVRFNSQIASSRMWLSSFIVEAIKREIVEISLEAERLLVEAKRKARGNAVMGKLTSAERAFCRSLCTRTSVFGVARKGNGIEKVLTSTQFRYCKHQPNHANPGRTRYSLEPAQGLGICYASRNVVLLWDLPNPESHPTGYVDAVHSEWSIPKLSIEKWRRKAQAFILVPLLLSPSDTNPSGVLCLDFLRPCSEFADSEMDEIAQQIQRIVMGRLALLWRFKE